MYRKDYAGSDWLIKQGETLSEFGVLVADLLGDLYYGIYHIDKSVLHKRVNWSSDRFIEIVVPGSLATYDNNDLTRLVFLCHERVVRCEIRAAAQSYLRLCFSPRKREGSVVERHPDIRVALEIFEGVG